MPRFVVFWNRIDFAVCPVPAKISLLKLLAPRPSNFASKSVFLLSPKNVGGMPLRLNGSSVCLLLRVRCNNKRMQPAPWVPGSSICVLLQRETEQRERVHNHATKHVGTGVRSQPDMCMDYAGSRTSATSFRSLTPVIFLCLRACMHLLCLRACVHA